MTRTITNLILSAVFVITSFSCSTSNLDPVIIDCNPPNFSFLALGDSYTIGQGVDELERWPAQLKSSLEMEGIAIEPLTVIAETGWTTTNLLNAIESEDPAVHDMVSLLIGVNNQYQNLSFSDFQIEFDSLLSIAIDLAGTKKNVFVVSIPDYGVTPFGASNSAQIATEIDNYNNYMNSQSNSLDIPFIDITSISRDLGSNDNALAPDNLHPSAFQYSLWIEEILPIALGILQ